MTGAGFWTERLTNHGPGAPLGGEFERRAGNWFTTRPHRTCTAAANATRTCPEEYTLGLRLREDGGSD